VIVGHGDEQRALESKRDRPTRSQVTGKRADNVGDLLPPRCSSTEAPEASARAQPKLPSLIEPTSMQYTIRAASFTAATITHLGDCEATQV
jgi:hypothetical protein